MDAPWHVGGVLKFTVRRDDLNSVESDMSRQVAEVSENEPGTILYGFHRLGLEAANSEFIDYLHVMAYADAAAQEAHWKAEEVWWWDKLSGYLGERPILAERFDALTLARQFAQGTADASLVALSVVLVTFADDQDGVDRRAGTSAAFGWVARRGTDHSGLFGALAAHQVVVVSSAPLGEPAESSADILASTFTVPATATIEHVRQSALLPIATLVRTA